MCIFMSVGVQR
ncbi:unnamed protein product [Cuscuta epithymum]|uniref:Uncharacterized protein n=1 Tax=Cuscuta epithymum TaxID=186058 RepID=A0AAV0EGF8_9ASTE|nr:unnamed protein product [Cuscuta epithymum]